MSSLIKISAEPLDIASGYEHLRHPASGGISTFIGTVRDHSGGRSVEKLWFEAYEEMALREMRKIAEEAQAQWPLNRLLMVHVTGEWPVGEPVVMTGASAAHREEAFKAARFLIDELKKRVPIWKKEFGPGKESWVDSRP